MKVKAIAAVAALTLAGSAFAQSDSQGVPGVDVDVNANVNMASTDKNSDGKITKTEAASNSKLTKEFDKLDANKDGSLDQGEFAKFEASAKTDKGEKSNKVNKPGTTDDSTPGNEDKLGPGR
jgi:EF hand